MRYLIRIFVYCVFCFYLGVPTCIAEKLYIWTDNEGTIHFTKTPPRNVITETLSYTKTSEHELREHRLKDNGLLIVCSTSLELKMPSVKKFEDRNRKHKEQGRNKKNTPKKGQQQKKGGLTNLLAESLYSE